MDIPESEKGGVSSEDGSQLNRNRSFKSKQLVRSQAIRESQSPPRTISPATSTRSDVDVEPNDDAVDVTNGGTRTVTASDVTGDVTSDASSHVSDKCRDVLSCSSRNSDIDDKKNQTVEIQITGGAWDAEPASEQRQRAGRWLRSSSSRDLLSNNPRVACVCGACAACPHCRGRRRKHLCSTKQDSGIVCSDDCPDCSDSEHLGGSNSDSIRNSVSLDADDQVYYCRCPERKDKPKNISLVRTDSDELTGTELVNFIKETLNKNSRDRMTLLKIEKELHSLINDTGRCIVKFPVMTSYGRMLVHRCAALFQLSHHIDHVNKTAVLVSKSGTSGGRIPCTSFRQWCVVTFPPSPLRHQPDGTFAKSILKRDAHSLEEAGGDALPMSRSKSLEQRERDYERVRRRIFSSDNCSQDESQWPWLTSGPIKLLTPEGGRNKLLKVQSLESSGPGEPGAGAGGASGAGGGGGRRGRGRGAVSKSHSFGGYAAADPPPHHHHQPRLLSRQGDLASSSWRLSPSSSGYKTLSLRSTDSATPSPSPTGGASPEPAMGVGVGVGVGVKEAAVVWAVSDLSVVPPGALVIHPQTGRPLTNPDGTLYHFDPANPPILYDPDVYVETEPQKLDQNNEKRRGRLKKQHSFIDNDCECQPTEESRSKCCCECRRADGCQAKSTSEKETNTKPPSPVKTNHNQNPTQNQTQEPTNPKPQYEAPTNQKASPVPQHDPLSNQRQAYENQIQIANRNFETANQRPPSNGSINITKLTSQDSQEFQYNAAYAQGYRIEEVTSPGVNQYLQQDMAAMQSMMAQAKITPVQQPDPNMLPMALTNVMYPTVVPQPYPYLNQCRMEAPVQPMYHQIFQQTYEDPKQLVQASHANENTFRIDPSYPYAAAVECGGCGLCDVAALHHHQHQHQQQHQQLRSSCSAGAAYGPVETPVVPAAYHLNPLLVPQQQPQLQLQLQPQMHHYPYQEAVGYGGTAVGGVPHQVQLQPQPQKVMVVPYTHYNLMYPQVLPQPYQICQPIYPVVEKQPDIPRRNSIPSHRQSKRNSISGSNRNTPLQTPEEKPPNNDSNKDENAQDSEIARAIHQIKDKMANADRDRDRFKRGTEDWRRRNSGNGILGSYPVNNFNGKPPRTSNDDTRLSSAALAIVNSIRNLQGKNTYQSDRRYHDNQNRYDYRQDRPDYRPRYRQDRDDKHYYRYDRTNQDSVPNGKGSDGNTDRRLEGRNRNFNPMQLQYRPPYLLRQMSPGAWCRRSPGPVHPMLNNPRRPHPDSRNGRR